MPFRQTKFSFSDSEKNTHALTLLEGQAGQQGAALLDGRWVVLRVLADEGRAEYRNGTLDFHLKSDRWGTSWTLQCAGRDFAGMKVEVRLQEAVLSKLEKGPPNELLEGENTDTILRRHGWKSHEGDPVEQAGPAERDLHETVGGMESRPVAARIVLFLNVLVWAIMVGEGVYSQSASRTAVIDWGAIYAPLVVQGQYWRLVTGMFLHIGLFHLLGNIVALWAAGPFVERMVGRAGFVVVYFVSGILASVASVYDYAGIPALGASGAVFGILGALVGLMFRYHVYVRRQDLIKYVVLVVLLVVQTVLYLVQTKRSIRGGVAVAAHGAGLISGVILGLLMSRPIAPARRNLRNALVGGAGILLAGILAWLRPPVVDVIRALESLEDARKEFERRMVRIVPKLERARGSSREMADLFDREIRAYWSSQTEIFERSFEKAPGHFRMLLPTFSTTFKLQNQGLALVSDAIRANDTSIMNVAMARFQEAESEVDRLLTQELE